MGVILILVLILLIWRGGKKKQKKRRRRTYTGKSDWEKMCDDGGKFYGWQQLLTGYCRLMVSTRYSDCVPMRNLAPQIPSPELT